MRIYCSGIGGIGLSAYAAHMRAKGHDVSGSDKSDSAVITDLKSQGINVTLNQDGSGVKLCDLFVYSEAIPESAPERKKAKELGIPQQSYFQALGEMTKGTDLICICGTHGKSSTTAMLAKVCIDLGLDPNVVVGTKMRELGGRNWRAGTSNFWIVEACEYRRSFLYLEPKNIIVTTIDGDHFDYFKDQADYEKAYAEFFSKLPKDGIVIGHGKDEAVVRVAKSAAKKFIDADTNSNIELATPGLHMRQNAALAMKAALLRNVPEEGIRSSLKTYAGTWRRMEVKGTTRNGITVIDDYGHHPAEIRATLSAMREGYPKKRIVAAYQPHTHDRTLKLWNEFATAFSDADMLVVSDVYDARPDKDAERVDLSKLVSDIESGSKIDCVVGGSIENTQQLLRSSILQSNDVLVIMGAGNITELATAMINEGS